MQTENVYLAIMRITICIFFITMLSLKNINGQQVKEYETIIIRTGLGEIHAKLDLKRAPVTSLNFLHYVDKGMFDSTSFYRVVRMDNQPHDSIKIQVIQGGRYKDEENGFPPIIHETTKTTGIRHKSGTISMARSQPGSATSEFFICIGDQPELDFGGKRNPDGQGFAAFGKIVKGMAVVNRIHSIKQPGQYLDKPVLIFSIKRAAK